MFKSFYRIFQLHTLYLVDPIFHSKKCHSILGYTVLYTTRKKIPFDCILYHTLHKNIPMQKNIQIRPPFIL